MTKFDPKGQYVQYGGESKREVYVQEGRFYNIKGDQLPWNLAWLEENNYCISNDLRSVVIEQQTKLKYAQEKAALDARMKADMEAQLRAFDTEAALHRKELEELNQKSEDKKKSQIKLTEVEKRLYGHEEVADDPVVDDDGYFGESDLKATKSPDPFEGLDTEEVVERNHKLTSSLKDPFFGKVTAAPEAREAVKATGQIPIRRKPAKAGV